MTWEYVGETNSYYWRLHDGDSTYAVVSRVDDEDAHWGYAFNVSLFDHRGDPFAIAKVSDPRDARQMVEDLCRHLYPVGRALMGIIEVAE